VLAGSRRWLKLTNCEEKMGVQTHGQTYFIVIAASPSVIVTLSYAGIWSVEFVLASKPKPVMEGRYDAPWPTGMVAGIT